jgi:TolB-like protein/cytochrome c-type biogenesis protein CcmH/NrfG
LIYQFDDYSLDVDRQELRRGAELVDIEPQVLDLLQYLIRHRERVVSKDDLIEHVWHGRIVSESTLTSRITAARQAIGDSGAHQRLIRTIARKGIRFVGEVRGDQSSPIGGSVTNTMLSSPVGTAPGLPDKPSIAVLPFTNMSGDPEQEYFADGMAEEILTALSHSNSLFVIARNSSFTYKGKAIDVRQVGRDLGVRYVLEGSVRRSGDRLRFTAQLIDATSGAQIWANRFDGGTNDVFELQDRIAESVVAVIEPNVQLAEIERMKRKPVANLDAYDLLLRAQQFEYEFSQESFDAALRCLEHALIIDPDYAQAMALAAYCYAERSQQSWSKDRVQEAAEGIRLATRAVELAKNDANVLWMAAYAARQLAMDAQLAKELAYRSLQLNPNSAIALAMTGWIETILGNTDKSLELLRRADRLSPRDPRTWFITTGLAMAYFTSEQFAESVIWSKKALAQNPRSAVALRLLAAALARLGQKEQANDAVRELLKIEPQLTISGLRARMRMLEAAVWARFSEGLRLAGLPE